MKVSRQAFYDYLANKEKPWKYEAIAESMLEMVNEEKMSVIIHTAE